MIAMQYSFTLPGDYPMERIRRRIEERGPTLNGLPGLVQKSYLYNEKGPGWVGNAVFNEYAPFYVWQSEEPMRNFLMSKWFEGLVDSFGRPVVRSWQVLEFDRRGVGLDYPAYALRETVPIPASLTLSQLAETEHALHQQALEQAGLHSRVVAFDPEHWELIRFSIWRNKAIKLDVEGLDHHSYQVLYLAS